MRQLDPKLAEWLAGVNAQVAQLKAAGFEATPISARESLANLTRTFVEPGPEMAVCETLVCGGQYRVPVRIYSPRDIEPGPVIIYSHGGGHMAGSVTVYDPICRRIAESCHRPLVSLDYRLAPENPYPAGLQDLLSVVNNLGPALEKKSIPHNNRWILMGDSGGGALCASASRLLQHQCHNIAAQVLIYPSLDYTMQTPSIDENGSGYLLEKEKIAWYFDNYFQGAENRRDASPLHGEFTGNLPKSLVITAEFCPLRDEGDQYLEKLQKAGIACESLHFDDMIHAFLNLESLVPEACETFYRNVGEFVRGIE
ncbi:alpha/beta hydrolase [Microbulbifer thermotolerans]|uniref:Carboxylesterase n=1 Tax=Microbulbifer thermotolerans TaxID=252514 RepID=A0A0M3M8Y5_MICTH|nr:alpha/beta hydrolase [Microbulbifer thermotolerans]AKH15680.1 lipase [Microbulbifer thermotolerans]AMX03694.1 carboxylesterase [Microbulbifer thermotolerans]MCX2781078.1 alpha/beta hydrolase [Microbulbifer thermotolerans]MCX2806395.1 alpha/beta hydrolase [Microbulbifer thermotolerans]MCX2832956.1 alpha/beta hydrolase [Microbulbifer thermotolerans]